MLKLKENATKYLEVGKESKMAEVEQMKKAVEAVLT